MNKRIKRKMNSILLFCKNNKIRLITIILVFLLFTYVFFQFNILVQYDSAKYYSYLKFFNGVESFKNWDIIRGPGFPFILFLFSKLFGDNGKGFLIGFYIFDLINIIISYIILKNTLIKDKKKNLPAHIVFLYLTLIVFCPLIIGYSHTMLTEAVIPTFYFITVMLCIKFYNVNTRTNLKKYILYSILLSYISSIVYFIKQPYAPTVWMAIFITSVLSGLHEKRINEFFKKFGVFVFSIVLTLLNIGIWNSFLHSQGQQNDSFSGSQLFASNIISMPYHFKLQTSDNYCNKNFINSKKLDLNVKKQLETLIGNSNLTDWCNFVKVYDVYDIDNQYLKTEIMFLDEKGITPNKSLTFLLKLYYKYPKLVVHSYYENYLTIVNLQNVANKFNDFTPIAGITDDVLRENEGIAYVIFEPYVDNAFWLWSNKSPIDDNLGINPTVEMKDFENYTSTNRRLSAVMRIIKPISNTLFKLLMFSSGFIMIYGLIRFIKSRNDKRYFIVTLNSGMAFSCIMFNTIFGANIDRYVYPTYPLMIIVFILFFMNKNDSIKNKEEK